MSGREIPLELAIGRRVRTLDGHVIGRLEDVRADDGWYVTEYLIGAAGLLERWSVVTLSLVGIARKAGGYSAGWNQLDLDDPRRPRLTCPPGDLARFE